MSKFDWAGFLIFVLVFVSRDFEVDRNVSYEESTASPRTELIFSIVSIISIINIIIVVVLKASIREAIPVCLSGVK